MSLQEERSAETQRRLLDATLECLHELGYGATTTLEIARRAGVSRGAQLHHFRRKEELVVRALEYVFDLRLAYLREIAVQLPTDRQDRVDALVDLLWPAFKGPTFCAWLELVVASRTDPTLREAVHGANERFAQGVHEVFRGLFGHGGEPSYAEPVELVIVALLEAFALKRILSTSESDDERSLEPLLSLVKVMAGALAERGPRPGRLGMPNFRAFPKREEFP
jgi:AcrR family transcriptional regulator